MKLYIYDSQQKNKRFLAVFVQNDIIQFKVHFGSENGMTFVDHGDIIKRANYLKRHAALNEDWNLPNSAGSLSRWILWGDSDNLETNIKAFKKRFKLQ
jgi:hypothetical protein